MIHKIYPKIEILAHWNYCIFRYYAKNGYMTILIKLWDKWTGRPQFWYDHTRNIITGQFKKFNWNR